MTCPESRGVGGRAGPRASDPDSRELGQDTEPTQPGLGATLTSCTGLCGIRMCKCKHLSPTALPEEFHRNQTGEIRKKHQSVHVVGMFGH